MNEISEFSEYCQVQFFASARLRSTTYLRSNASSSAEASEAISEPISMEVALIWPEYWWTWCSVKRFLDIIESRCLKGEYASQIFAETTGGKSSLRSWVLPLDLRIFSQVSSPRSSGLRRPIPYVIGFPMVPFAVFLYFFLKKKHFKTWEKRAKTCRNGTDGLLNGFYKWLS